MDIKQLVESLVCDKVMMSQQIKKLQEEIKALKETKNEEVKEV
jgi:hypothetical protein